MKDDTKSRNTYGLNLGYYSRSRIFNILNMSPFSFATLSKKENMDD